jgi:hypothetical protein
MQVVRNEPKSFGEAVVWGFRLGTWCGRYNTLIISE